jgi:hypothetical protein
MRRQKGDLSVTEMFGNVLTTTSKIKMPSDLHKMPFCFRPFPKACFPRGASWVAALLIFTIFMECSAVLGAGGCEVAQSTFDSDVRYMQQHPPTHMRLQSSRYVELRRAERGLKCSGTTLVAFDGLHYRPAGWSDDPGLYLWVPRIARIFGISLARATDTLLIGAVLLASGFGLLGLLLTVHTTLGWRIGLVVFFWLTLVVLIAGDVYVMNAAPAIAFVPWILSFVSRKHVTISMLVTFGIAGFVSEIANIFRAHAGTGLLLFTLVVAGMLYQVKPGARLMLAMLLLLSAATPQLLFRELYARRDAFLMRQSGAMPEAERAHPFWHSIYIGLSYVKNSEIPLYRDEIAFAKVQALRPDAALYSPEYEQVLKQETFNLARRRPLLIVANGVVKLAVLSLFCICAINVGLYGVKLARKPACLELAFWLAIAFNGLYGLLVVPNPKYLVGLISFAALYGIYSIDYAARHPYLQDRFGWLEKLVFIRSRPSSSFMNAAPEPAGNASGLPVN